MFREVDEALLMLGLVDDAEYKEYVDVMLQNFEPIYGCKPGSFGTYHPLMQQTMNCDANLRALRASHVTATERGQALEAIRKIKKEFEKVQRGCKPLIDLKDDVKNLQLMVRNIIYQDFKVLQQHNDQALVSHDFTDSLCNPNRLIH